MRTEFPPLTLAEHAAAKIDLSNQKPFHNNIIKLEKVLMIAAAMNNKPLYNHFLNNTALNEFKDHFILKILVVAAEKGHIEQVKNLLTPEIIESNIDVVLQAFTKAATNGHLAVVKELLTYQAVRDDVAAGDNSAFIAAAENDHLDIVKKLLTYPAVRKNIAASNNYAFIEAARKGHLAVVQKLLSYKAVRKYVAANNNEALKCAAAGGHLAVMKELLIYQAVRKAIATEDNGVLKEAAANGHLAVVEKLLTYQAVRKAIATGNNSAFIAAAKNGHLAVMKKLLTYPAMRKNIAGYNNFAFRMAAENGHLDIVKELLTYTAVRKAIATEYNYALRWAAMKGHLEVAKKLLTFSAVKRNITADNNGAFRWAAENGHLDIVKKLLTYPAVRKAIATDDNYALQWAAEKGHLAVVKTLLTYPEVRKNVAANNNYALRWAALKGHLSIVQELLIYKAVRKNIAAHTDAALNGAIESGHLAIVEKLLATYQAMKIDITAIKDHAFKGATDHLCMLEKLLSFDIVKNDIDAIKMVFQSVAANGNLVVVEKLLPYVQDHVAALNNQALRSAARNGHLAVVEKLLTYQAVKDNVAALDNQALNWAAHNGHIDVVRLLLTHSEVKRIIDVDNNAVFREAVEKGHILVVSELLKYPAVFEKVTANNNYALCTSMDKRHTEVVKALLKFPAVMNALIFEQAMKISMYCKIKLTNTLFLDTVIAKSCLSKKALLRIINQLKPEHVAAHSLLIHYLAYYGYDAINRKLKGAKLIAAIQKSVDTSFAKPFRQPKTHAGAILQFGANVKDLKQSIYEDLAGNAESAMDESLLIKANERFNEKIKPAFEKQFTSIEDIEKKLCELLLNRKLSQKITRKARRFIKKNKAALIERDPTILAQSRPYFNSLTDTVDIACRAVDAGAPTRGWEKLFVAPPPDKEKNHVYSTGATHQGSLNLLQTTQITRERLCYTYLVATDPELTPEQRVETINKLVFYIAEISRAHNEQDAQGSDNPSCFPGTITRLDLVFQAHPKFTVPHNLFDLTHNIARQLVVRKFGAALEKASDKRALYEAVTLFSDINAREIIHKPDSVLDTQGEKADLEKLLNIRKEFYSDVFGENGEDGVCFINNKLLEEFNLSLNEETNIIALNAFINMSGKETAFSITEAYQRAVPAVIEARMLTNPYLIKLEKILEVLQHVPETLKYKVAQQRFEKAQQKAVDFDLIFDRLKMALSPLTAEKVFDAAQIVVEARFNAQNERELNETELEQVLANLSEELTIPVDSLKTRCTFIQTRMDVEIAPLAPTFLPQSTRENGREMAKTPKPVRVACGYELRAIPRP